jgi:hypothetical protein
MGNRLAARRRSGFVGRERELTVLSELLGDPDDGAVLFVWGPGGVGKSTLLRQYEWLGQQAGRHVVRIDGREAPPVAAAFLAELAVRAGCTPEPEPLEQLGSLTGLLLLIDTAELLAPLDPWIREELLPALAADTITVVAGRESPGLAWRTDPGWLGLVRSVRLDNLTHQEGRRLLEQRGVPAVRHSEALAFTRGHPLALALVADVVAQGAGPLPPAEMPDLVNTLVGSLVETVPSPRHLSALEACAQVLATTESLLAELLGIDDAHEMFGWLRGLSIVESGPQGLFPHDLARDALGAQLRWRHPERYAELHRRAGAYYRRMFYTVPPQLQHQILVEYVYLHRENPVLGPFVVDSANAGIDLRSLAATPPADDAERALARAIVERHEGPDSADLLNYWLDRQPGALLLIRGADGEVLGLVVTLALQHLTTADRDRDVAVRHVGAFLDRLPELLPGEVAGFFRFWMQRDRYQELGAVQMFITLHFVRYYLSTPNLAYSFVYYADADLWAEICAYADVTRIPDADFTVGGRTYGVYWHDWRRVPPLDWLELLGERETARTPLTLTAPTPTAALPAQRLSDQEFAAAVKDALRGLTRAGGLRTSPLLHTALVATHLPADADDRTRSEELRTRIRAAAARLEASPRDRRGYRALHHTYLQPAATQAQAAELLDLPMSTYRRHLATGIERLTQILRQEEKDNR